MTSQDETHGESGWKTGGAVPMIETIVAGIMTALTGLNGAWLSTAARYLLGVETIAVLTAGTIVTGAVAARHLRNALTPAAPSTGRTWCAAAVFIVLIALGAWIGRAHALGILDEFYR